MIEIEHLVKTFGEIKAVDDLSLPVPKKKMVGFLGPNGAGKTTTIKILTNLISATRGTAMLNGIDVTKEPKKALAHVGAVVETPEFYPYLTPVETLAYLGRIRGMSSREISIRTEDVLNQVKMTEWRTTRIGKFSKGMKQRLAIAQAMLHEPEILILDEPTSGLDPRGMVEVREIIKGLKKREYTIFMSSHLLGEVQETCDKAALIERGRLLVYDDIDNLKKLTRTSKIEVTTVDQASEEMLSRIGGLANVKDVASVNPQTFVVTLENSDANRADLLLAVQRLGLKISGFSPVGLPLEMMYMDMVKESR
ncbi:MAG: ABC transporter ATP-binding protein [Methanobacteriota archaeon]|nr:MAG: ABC transporter ATP-binding protein [Euryarchaeota archaeon]